MIVNNPGVIIAEYPESIDDNCECCGKFATLARVVFYIEREVHESGLSIEWDEPLSNDIDIVYLCSECM